MGSGDARSRSACRPWFSGGVAQHRSGAHSLEPPVGPPWLLCVVLLLARAPVFLFPLPRLALGNARILPDLLLLLRRASGRQGMPARDRCRRSARCRSVRSPGCFLAFAGRRTALRSRAPKPGARKHPGEQRPDRRGARRLRSSTHALVVAARPERWRRGPPCPAAQHKVRTSGGREAIWPSGRRTRKAEPRWQAGACSLVALWAWSVEA